MLDHLPKMCKCAKTKSEGERRKERKKKKERMIGGKEKKEGRKE